MNLLKMIKKICLAGLVVSVPMLGMTEPVIGRAQAPLVLDGQGPWYRLDFNANTQLLSASPSLGDIRIVDKNRVEQPYAFFTQKAQITSDRRSAEAGLFPLYESENAPDGLSGVEVRRTGNTVSLRVAAENRTGKKSLLRGYLMDMTAVEGTPIAITLNWLVPRDGFYPFSIEGSNDLQHWHPVMEGQLYRLSFNNRTIEKNVIDWPEARGNGKPSYIRLLWSNPENNARITKVRVSAGVDVVKHEGADLSWSKLLVAHDPVFEKPLRHSSFKQNLRVTANDAHSVTDQVYDWSFATAHNFQAMELELPQGYTLAPFILYGRQNAHDSWREISHGVFYRLVGEDGIEMIENIKTFRSAPISQLRLVIDGRGGGLGMAKPLIRLGVEEKTMVFLGKGEAPFTFLSGRQGQTSAALSFNILVPGAAGLEDRRISSARFASAPVVETLVNGIVEPERFNWKLLPLWGLLFIGVAFLLWAAFRLLKVQDKSAQ